MKNTHIYIGVRGSGEGGGGLFWNELCSDTDVGTLVEDLQLL